MSTLDQLQPMILPAPISFWPLAPGWWLLLALLPLLGYGLWRARVLLPKRAPDQATEQPLDPLRQSALVELAQMPKPYDGAPAGACTTGASGLAAISLPSPERHVPGSAATGTPSCAATMNSCQACAGKAPPVTFFIGAPSSLPNQTPVVRFAV